MGRTTNLFLITNLILLSGFSIHSPSKDPRYKNNSTFEFCNQIGNADSLVNLTPTQQDTLLEQPTELNNLEVISLETKASYYHDKFVGKKTASGLLFDNKAYTAAHRSLPFGTKVKVTNLKNDKSVVVTITDRGPFTKGREIDITKKAFSDLTQNKAQGLLNVKIERITNDDI